LKELKFSFIKKEKKKEKQRLEIALEQIKKSLGRVIMKLKGLNPEDNEK